jgi:NADPH-dependent 2,4-dienoyl-CoA reductase/sulfur reductase-like enzyme/rhodanese-related sulfurtransferase/two-component sensor histidine kinase
MPMKEIDKDPQSENTAPDQNGFRILSHQLKSPLHTIQTLLETISHGFTGEVSPKAQQLLEKAIDRTAEANQLISDLLNYELLAQKKELPASEIDLVLLVNTLVTRYAPRAAEKGISLQADLPLKEKIIIRGEARSLEQAARNILENGLNYTPEQGRVNVSLSADAGTQRCLLTIQDTGYGIPPAELERIFEPFYRSFKHKAHVPGTGLGLPIAQRVIEQHGGSITVESKENQGTRFTVELPLTRLVKSAERAQPRKRVIIIGGVTAGPKAAARLRRLDESLDITIIEKSQFLSYAGCGLPSYISGRVRSPMTLMSTSDNTLRDVHFFEAIKNIRVLNKTLALKIDRRQKRVRIRRLESGLESWLPYDTLVLATGALPRLPAIPGIHQEGIYSLYSLDDAEAIKRKLAAAASPELFIIGGGLIGISLAESLVETGARVTILEKADCVLCNLMDPDMAGKLENVLHRQGIKIITSTRITAIRRQRRHLRIESPDDVFPADLVILTTGVKPNTGLAEKAGLEIGSAGGVKVNAYLETSDSAIYAAGDCAESVNIITGRHEYWPLGSISTKMGRIAADNICGRKSVFTGTNGTALFTIGDTRVARTGLTSRAAEQAGFAVESVIVTGLDRSHYHPDARDVMLKILADKKTGRILGAQGFSRGEVISKIEILSAAISQALSLGDVFRLDLGYNPAFNSPIDILQTACAVLGNKLDGLLRTITLEELESERRLQAVNVVDVSPAAEHLLGALPDSINIPLENLRLEGIPFTPEQKVVLYSRTSSGAYKAYQYLSSQGYTNLYVLEGGYVWYES